MSEPIQEIQGETAQESPNNEVTGASRVDNINDSPGNYIGLGLAIVVIVTMVNLIALAIFGLENLSKAGDAFGIANSVFAGLAFAGVIIAIFLQKQELALQRRELQQTREVLAETAKTQKASEEALRETANVQREALKAALGQAEALKQSAAFDALRFAPLLTCSVSSSLDRPIISIQNLGSVPALDVEILALALLDGKSDLPVDFLGRNFKNEFRNTVKFQPWEVNGCMWFGLWDQITVGLLPADRTWVGELAFSPEHFTVIQVLLQCRDLRGHNFWHVHGFRRVAGGQWSFEATSRQPNRLNAGKRYSARVQDWRSFDGGVVSSFAVEEPEDWPDLEEEIYTFHDFFSGCVPAELAERFDSMDDPRGQLVSTQTPPFPFLDRV